MASLTIRLRVDPATKKKDVIISYSSDADALPMEHEEEHRRLVRELISGGVLGASELGRVVVEREASEETGAPAERSRAEPIASPSPVGRGKG